MEEEEELKQKWINAPHGKSNPDSIKQDHSLVNAKIQREKAKENATLGYI